MQINPELILNAISLSINGTNDTHKKIVQDFININDEASNAVTGLPESSDAVSQLYMDILKSIHVNGVDKSDENAVLSTLLKFEASPIVQKDPVILTTLRQLFTSDIKLSIKKIEQLATNISTSISLYIANKYIRRMFGKTMECEKAHDVETKKSYLDAIVNDSRNLSDILVDNKNQLENSITDRYLEKIDMSNKDDIKKAIKQHSNRSKHVFKTGLQGLNRMFGKSGGFKLGESITINALKHNYKSGMLLSFAKWIVTHNKPYVDPEHPGIPTILFITLENEANENIMWWFESMYANAYGKPPEGLSDDDIVEIVYEFFQKSGYNLIIERKLGPDFGFEEYVQMYESYRKSGHRILVTIIDYMNMMKKSIGNDKSGGRSDLALRELYNKMCNFNKSRMTTQISAHQLNRDAARLVVGGTNVVRKFNDSHYADGMDVGREVDMEIFIHIEQNNSGVPFLTMQRGKHRYVNDTPDKDKYTAYAFGKWGIMDDIDTEDMSVKNIYAEDVSEEEAIASIKDGSKDKSSKVLEELF